MLVANACCDGNLLLSWGPQWNGEFAPTEKARLLEVGEWLKENGRAIYGTRGGPWKWSSWGGSTRRDKTAWLHVVKAGKLELPTLPGRTVLSAQTLENTHRHRAPSRAGFDRRTHLRPIGGWHSRHLGR
jgi:alpha-L-fucosidase